jgi:hypothetical protein
VGIAGLFVVHDFVDRAFPDDLVGVDRRSTDVVFRILVRQRSGGDFFISAPRFCGLSSHILGPRDEIYVIYMSKNMNLLLVFSAAALWRLSYHIYAKKADSFTPPRPFPTPSASPSSLR